MSCLLVTQELEGIILRQLLAEQVVGGFLVNAVRPITKPLACFWALSI
jgi:hypothetical protein